jgi:ComF family protein
MLPRLSNLAGKAYDFLFPRRCVGCGREGGFICPACRTHFVPIAPPLCSLCGIPLSSGSLCSSCAGWEAAIDGIRSAFRFEGPVREAVHQLKYQNLKAIAPNMAALMVQVLDPETLRGDVFVPIPLHPKRLKERGYNQSTLLSRELGRLLTLPVDEKCLVRQRNTRSQARTRNVLERRENVSGAFFCPNNNLTGRRVILIDDVATSGATLNAGAAALKSAGALSVRGITFAREV